MSEANQIITRNFQEQKQEMESQIADLKGDVSENMRNFKKECPRALENKNQYVADLEENRRANEKISEFRIQCSELRKREDDMIKGLEIFDIMPDTYNELKVVEGENENLSLLWQIKQEWDDQWMQWKDIQFFNLDIT
jgi:DNA repair exonuclease SbcCD ATPase subunit